MAKTLPGVPALPQMLLVMVHPAAETCLSWTPKMRQVDEVEPWPLESADSAGAGHEADTAEAQRGIQGEGGAGGNQGRPDRRRAGGAFRGPPEPDPQLEEATVGRCGERFRGQRVGGGSPQ